MISYRRNHYKVRCNNQAIAENKVWWLLLRKVILTNRLDEIENHETERSYCHWHNRQFHLWKLKVWCGRSNQLLKRQSWMHSGLSSDLKFQTIHSLVISQVLNWNENKRWDEWVSHLDIWTNLLDVVVNHLGVQANLLVEQSNHQFEQASHLAVDYSHTYIQALTAELPALTTFYLHQDEIDANETALWINADFTDRIDQGIG